MNQSSYISHKVIFQIDKYHPKIDNIWKTKFTIQGKIMTNFALVRKLKVRIMFLD